MAMDGIQNYAGGIFLCPAAALPSGANSRFVPDISKRPRYTCRSGIGLTNPAETLIPSGQALTYLAVVAPSRRYSYCARVIEIFTDARFS